MRASGVDVTGGKTWATPGSVCVFKAYPLIHAIHALALPLGLNVIAEGVETEAQRECLMAIGVKTRQGHLFMPSHSIEEIGSALNIATP